MLLGGTVCSCPQDRNDIGDSPRYFGGCPPGSNMGSSISQNSCLHLGHIAAAIILKPEVSIETPKIKLRQSNRELNRGRTVESTLEHRRRISATAS